MSALVGGMGPPVNKFEQVSSDSHQMLLVGEPGCGVTEMRVPMFDVSWEVGLRRTCTVRPNASLVVVTWGLPGQTD